MWKTLQQILKKYIIYWIGLINLESPRNYSITDSMDMSLSELWDLVMDREAWRASIHGAAKSQTQLSDWTELNF